ncbi:MAG TPA: cytochrome o ubiquinol oxidase subunit IV [Candidatus Saccharimonadales bacterium]|nr:cytochrome o ubiquinol oxidase subunit IV [Candidatus Saccharimonadales bacterium]
MKDKLTARNYIAGYIFSLSLTLAAFLLVWRYVDSDRQIFSEGFLFAWIAALALVQLFAQLIFFLHLGRESKPRWNLAVLAFAATIVIILVFGSLWIMANLNYRGGHGTSPQQTETYIIEDEGFQLHQ